MKTKFTISTYILIFLSFLMIMNLISIEKKRERIQVCTGNGNQKILAEWISFHSSQFDVCVVGRKMSIKSGIFQGSFADQCKACFGNDNAIVLLEPNEFLNIIDTSNFKIESFNAIHRIYFGFQDTYPMVARTFRGPNSALNESKERFKEFKKCIETKDGNSCMDLTVQSVINRLSNKQLKPCNATIARIHHYSMGGDAMDKEREYWTMIYDDSILRGLDIAAHQNSIRNMELELVF
jgi:hypothetical protein